MCSFNNSGLILMAFRVSVCINFGCYCLGMVLMLPLLFLCWLMLYSDIGAED